MTLPMYLGGGNYGEIWRATVDWRGDTTHETRIGTVPVVFGGRSSTVRNGREYASDTTGLVGCPRDTEFRLELNDKIVIEGIKYRVIGPRTFDYPSSITGESLGYYWCEVRAVV